MNAADYFEKHPPSFKNRSKIAPFENDLLEYKNRGYTLIELQGYLIANGVKISLAGISAYIRRKQLKSGGNAKQTAVDCNQKKSTLQIAVTGTNHNRPAGFGSFKIKPDTKDL